MGLFSVAHVRQTINSYTGVYAMSRVVVAHYVPVYPEFSTHIASLYDKLPGYDASDVTRQAYTDLAEEVHNQWDHALRSGYSFEPWDREGQPYATSKEMQKDVAINRHLYFFTGGEPHPYLSQVTSSGFSYNDMLRAIHDLFGHAAEGYQFGARGEENAWLHHSQMFTYMAQRALTTETRGQNSWFNYGPYSNLPRPERPFATQKVALLPEYVSTWDYLLYLSSSTGGA